ncbi:MAG TPA: DUF5615 family PIN-like protein [Gemmatimonadales bacterium]
MGLPLRFYLDEDVGPRVAVIARGLGLDVVAAQEAGRTGLSDYDQLRQAGEDQRVLVTFNRNDFIHWTREFFRGGRPHYGVLILSRSLPRDQPERIAHALAEWAAAATDRFNDPGDLAYLLDFVS